MTQRPNILFLFPDQQRGDWLGDTAPVKLHTPHVQRLAREGTRFTHAICPSPVCAPSRACMATGMRYERCSVMNNKDNLSPDLPTVYQLLRDAGYSVMGCGKFDLAKDTYDWQLDGSSHLAQWGFTAGCDNEGKIDGILSGKHTPAGPYMQWLEEHGLRHVHIDDLKSRHNHAVHATALPDEAYCDNWIGDKAERLIHATPKDQPWFLQVNFTGPHNPWDITARMLERARQIEGLPAPVNNDDGAAEGTHHKVRQNYGVMIENIDRWVGRLIDAIASRGELDNTIIVYSSDHGEMLGDHNRWGKSNPLQPSVHVPLVIANAPDLPNATIDKPTDILDLTASFLQWANIDVPTQWDSAPLATRLANHPGVAFTGLNDWRLVTDGQWKYIAWKDGKQELFDLASDPSEMHDRIEDQPDRAATMRAQLESYYSFDRVQ